MAHLVDEIDWQHCMQCNNNNWDDCVAYAMDAAEYGEIGCEYLVFKDKGSSVDGAVPSST